MRNAMTNQLLLTGSAVGVKGLFTKNVSMSCSKQKNAILADGGLVLFLLFVLFIKKFGLKVGENILLRAFATLKMSQIGNH
jgi:hypothetical protein